MTIFTSLFPQVHGVLSRNLNLRRVAGRTWESHPLAQNFQTLAEVLAAHHYFTMWVAPLHFRDLAFRLGFSRGFAKTVPPVFRRSILREGDDSGFEIDRWNQILNRLKNSKSPFFMFVHSYITHMPYIAPELQKNSRIPFTRDQLLNGFSTNLALSSKHQDRLANNAQIGKKADYVKPCLNLAKIGPCAERLGSDFFGHAIGQYQLRWMYHVYEQEARVHDQHKKEATVSQIQHAYNDGVRDEDAQVGKMWHAITAAGLQKNTIFVFLADHGDELFERGDGSHSSFYDSIIHVPLVMVGPGIPAGHVLNRMVSLVDVLPTVLSDVDLPIPKQAEGVSIFRETHPEQYEFGYTLGLEYIRSQNWKLLRDEKGQEELYYLPWDHEEKRNLIHYWGARAVASRLRTRLNRWVLETAL